MNIKKKSSYVMVVAMAAMVVAGTYAAQRPTARQVDTRSEDRLKSLTINLFYDAGFTPVAPIRVAKTLGESTVTVRLVRDEALFTGIVTCPARKPCAIKDIKPYDGMQSTETGDDRAKQGKRRE